MTLAAQAHPLLAHAHSWPMLWVGPSKACTCRTACQHTPSANQHVDIAKYIFGCIFKLFLTSYIRFTRSYTLAHAVMAHPPKWPTWVGCLAVALVCLLPETENSEPA